MTKNESLTWTWNGDNGEVVEDGIVKFSSIIDLEDGIVEFYRRGGRIGWDYVHTMTEAKTAAAEWLRNIR